MLPRSLSGRIVGLGIIAALVIIVAAGLLLQATDRTRSAFLWVSQNENVIREVDELLSDVREAESGQRGFLLTRSAAYLDSFNERIASVQERGRNLKTLTAADPDQLARVDRLGDVIDAKVDSLRKPLDMAQGGRFEDAIAFVSGGRGRSLMEELARRADSIKAAEESLLKLRMHEAEQQSATNHDLLLFGGPVAAFLIGASVLLLVRSFRRPLGSLLEAINGLGQGRLDIRASTNAGLVEVDRLASAYNTMADRLSAAIESQAASDRLLQAANTELRERGSAVEILGGMAHRMQAAHSDDELAEVLHCFLPRILPHAPGALFVQGDARNRLTRIASWGIEDGLPDSFAADECWALRRGRSHFLSGDGEDVCCRHVRDVGAGYHCEPVLAAGETVGLLYLEGVLSEGDRDRLAALSENIALALVNQRLQRNLRLQSICDPLTGLFNRRHHEDVLAQRIERAGRTRETISAVMCDLDHFKRVNDQFGHEAGDIVLQAVAGELQRHLGEEGTVCRYGGEEFSVIVPGLDPTELLVRLEVLRANVSGLAVSYRGQVLDGITMSFGLASRSGDERTSGAELLRRADQALYRAKATGRNRVCTAEEVVLRQVAAE